jgi:phytoene synthase
MTISYPRTWEHTLLSLAGEARRSAASPTFIPLRDKDLLARAYRHCDAVIAAHSRSFHVATSLLPPDKRRAVRALYAFCRVSDNIVDCPQGDVAAALATWRQRALSPEPPADDLIATAWADTRLRYRIPRRYVEQLIEGVAHDLPAACGQRPKRYQTFEELAAYAYGVASTVGLMSMHIVGFSGPQAIPYAIKLGVALQLTNILRDVGEDWRVGRLYLPLEELAAFGLAESDLDSGRVDERWRAFARFQIERNRRLYAEARPGIAMLSKEGRFAVAAAGELYRAILDDIEAHDYDVFNRRAHVSALGKLGRLPGIWWRAR